MASVDPTLYTTKIKYMFITPPENLSTKDKPSFGGTKFGQLSVGSAPVSCNLIFCGVCLEQAKNEDADREFSQAKVKCYPKGIPIVYLIKHCMDAHAGEDTQKSQPSSTSRFSLLSTLNTGNDNRRRHIKSHLAQDLALWFALTLIPFDTVENHAMADFFTLSNVVTDADLPLKRNIVREGLEELYNITAAYINDCISNQCPRFGALTADMWTDQYRRRNYITCTFHFLSQNMTIRKFTLATMEVNKRHTAEIIRDTILEVLRCFKVDQKNIFLVTDAGGHMKRAANLLGFDNHICLGNALHFLVNVDGISNTGEISKLLKKCKKIVEHVGYRAPRIEAASAEQNDLLAFIEEFADHVEYDDSDSTDSESYTTVTPERALSFSKYLQAPPAIKTSTGTRWYSVLMMLKGISNSANRKAINTILNEIGQDSLVLNKTDYENIEAVIKFLENLKQIVGILSTETQPTINLAVIFRSEIKRFLETMDNDEPLVIRVLKNNMLARLESRFPLTDVVVAATLLDCRFHGIDEIDKYMKTRGTTKVAFLASMVRRRLSTEDISPQSKPRDFGDFGVSSFVANANFLFNLARKHTSADTDNSAIENECMTYLATARPENVQFYGGDVLQYWRTQRNRLPSLYALARSILSIPATSAPSERVFSTAGLAIAAKRARLNPTHVNKIMFIHDNYVCV